MATYNIAVLGSLNMDFITRTPRLPAPGETVLATSFNTGLGGKGANQAVACSRLAPPNISVHMVGNVGDDAFGKEFIAALEGEGMDVEGVRMLEGKRTGVANIIVEEGTGENRILVTTGANYEFEKEEEDGEARELVPVLADVVVFQLEIPLATVLHNIRSASESGKHVIFNPAPAATIPDWTFAHIDTLIMNESESVIMAGQADVAHQSPEHLAVHFLRKGVKDAVIITLGGQGLVYATASESTGRLAAKEVKVVDTTAAGDTFVGAYAVARALYDPSTDKPFEYEQALEFATIAAGKAVRQHGAMAAIPHLGEVMVARELAESGRMLERWLSGR